MIPRQARTVGIGIQTRFRLPRRRGIPQTAPLYQKLCRAFLLAFSMRHDAVHDGVMLRKRHILRLHALMLAHKRRQLMRRLHVQRLRGFPRTSAVAHAFPLDAKFKPGVLRRATVHNLLHHVLVLIVLFRIDIHVTLIATRH